MMRLALLTLVGLGALIGCSGGPGKVPDPVTVKGQVTFADGKPVKDVMLSLQPMDSGHPAGAKLGADGTFTAKVVPGKYAYFFTVADGKPASALQAIPEKYRSAHLDNTVQVGSGDLQIKLN